MCMICNDFQKEIITTQQAFAHLFEMKELIGKNHVGDVLNIIIDHHTNKDGYILMVFDNKRYSEMIFDIAEFANGGTSFKIEK